MKQSTDELITWYFTAGVAAGFALPGDEGQYRGALAKLKGKQRSGIPNGVKQGVNDLLHMADGLQPDKSDKVEAALKSRGLPSLAKMQSILQRKHLKILKAGKIGNDEEYYLVTELLSDTSSLLTALQRVNLGDLATSYEETKKTA